ncbi:putative magnesium and cobalt transport protein [Trypanosoma rangeli]|uniref:Putative magnesium and cobalt transport protein n=1 Tax=Trypanosoma rangeli TaxID=5698 RepID=A0A422NR97_TRYRA|nr:putative magnesium and cobalt transport protein [Trypanosoma rangeli]RNF07971.1 putative magnesium and cobalt transport protein [Trypanosoma rangeli]|eukprot:RNF07971.1 putative magnesium and cobalt transport protein [Trypanosoma rangeli]
MLTSPAALRGCVFSRWAFVRSFVVQGGGGGGVTRALRPDWGRHLMHTPAASVRTDVAGSGVYPHQEYNSFEKHADDLGTLFSALALYPSSSPGDEGIVAVSRTPPPRKRVPRWFFPGLTGEVEQRGGVEPAANKLTATSGEREGMTHASTESRRMSSAGDTAAHTSQAASEPARGEHGGATTTTTTTTHFIVPAPASSLDDGLPLAFCKYEAQRNQRIKAFLVTAMGGGFAKASTDSDGPRMSFSAASAAAAKEAVGLRRVSPKLLISFLSCSDNAWSWVDITAHPTASLDEYRDALSEVLIDLGTHETLVSDALEPMLLPQTTVMRGCHCLVVRYAEDAAKASMDGFQDLTNRLTIFVTDKRVITIHRLHCVFVEKIKQDWTQLMKEESKTFLLSLLVKEAVDTFNTALTRCIVEFDGYEGSLFSSEGHRSTLARQIYHIKRRASVYTRTLSLLGDAYSHVCGALPVMPNDVQFQDVQQDIAHVRSLSEELLNSADSGLQLLFQLSSYQLNELMRVLTIFSAFFIPLSFVASIYGMNFTHLPLIEDKHGHMYCIALMVAVGSSLGGWFKFKRFM